MDRGAKVLLVLCFIMVGALAFTAGILFGDVQHKGDSPISSDSDTLNRKPAVDYSVDMGRIPGQTQPVHRGLHQAIAYGARSTIYMMMKSPMEGGLVL